LSRKVFLTLKQAGDVALELDDFAGHGFGRAGTDEAASDGCGEMTAPKIAMLRRRMQLLL